MVWEMDVSLSKSAPGDRFRIPETSNARGQLCSTEHTSACSPPKLQCLDPAPPVGWTPVGWMSERGRVWLREAGTICSPALTVLLLAAGTITTGASVFVFLVLLFLLLLFLLLLFF